MDIKEKFNNISINYDAKRRMFIPCFDAFYAETTRFITHCIRIPKTVIDLGAGTGLLSYYWYKNIPTAEYVLMDIAEGMLDVAKQRFANCENVSFEIGNYDDYLPHVKFDVAISALSVHHLDDTGKDRLFRKIHDQLPSGGIFANYDQFCATDGKINELFSNYWENGLRTSGLTHGDLELWLERQKLDRECSVQDEIKMLKDSGFSSVECIFSYQKFSVILAIKSS